MSRDHGSAVSPANTSAAPVNLQRCHSRARQHQQLDDEVDSIQARVEAR